jgi:hypothetical protein
VRGRVRASVLDARVQSTLPKSEGQKEENLQRGKCIYRNYITNEHEKRIKIVNK